MKLIYVVIDGMGDLPIKELNERTPLEFANTPNMDFLANRGRLGRMYTINRGIAPESDVAVISILGYDPYEYHVGRGPLEVYGAGLNMKSGDLALRCNFATLGEGIKIIDRRVGRNLTTEEASELAKSINRDVNLSYYPSDFEFKNTLGHRGALVIRSHGEPLSGNVSNTDPAYERINGLGVAKVNVNMILNKCNPLDDKNITRVSAGLVNEFTQKSHNILDDHPVNRRREKKGKLKANTVLMRDAGDELPNFFNINERYNVEFACLADMSIERGISRLAGMDTVEIPPPSGNMKSDSVFRANKLLSIRNSYDCFYIHLKGPDEPGHDGNFELKTRLIEFIDEYFFGNLLSKIDPRDNIICVTSDHSTPCEAKTHSDDPVPLLIVGPGIHQDKSKKFSERECKKGSIGLLERGTLLMPMLMNYLKKTT